MPSPSDFPEKAYLTRLDPGDTDLSAELDPKWLTDDLEHQLYFSASLVAGLLDAGLMLAVAGEGTVLAGEGEDGHEEQEERITDLRSRRLLKSKRAAQEEYALVITDAGRDFIRAAFSKAQSSLGVKG